MDRSADATPVHPGKVLKQEFMVPLGLSPTALAAAIGVTPARVSEIVRCRRGITAETALRLARYFNTDAQSWMTLQARYELAVAEQKAPERLEDEGRGPARSGPISQDFWVSPTLEELADAQNVKPLDTGAVLGTWPGEDDDGFEETVNELRHGPKKDVG